MLFRVIATEFNCDDASQHVFCGYEINMIKYHVSGIIYGQA